MREGMSEGADEGRNGERMREGMSEGADEGRNGERMRGIFLFWDEQEGTAFFQILQF